METIRLGRGLRAIRLRQRLRQGDVAERAGLSRSTISRLERGQWASVSVGAVEAAAAALGARLATTLNWSGADLHRLVDARHAALATSIKGRLERWGWLVAAEATFSRYGERGRIDLLAWHPHTRTLLVVEIKTDLIDVQALLGSLDAKARLAGHVAERFGWRTDHVVPAIVFLEDRTTRRRLSELAGLFDRYELRGVPAISWVRRPGSLDRRPRGVLWFRSLPNAHVMRISGQRVRISRRGRNR